MSNPRVDNRVTPESITAAVVLLWIHLVWWAGTAIDETFDLVSRAWSDSHHDDVGTTLRLMWGLGIPLCAVAIVLSKLLWRGNYWAWVATITLAATGASWAVVDVLLSRSDLVSPLLHLASWVLMLMALSWRSSRHWCRESAQ